MTQEVFTTKFENFPSSFSPSLNTNENFCCALKKIALIRILGTRNAHASINGNANNYVLENLTCNMDQLLKDFFNT